MSALAGGEANLQPAVQSWVERVRSLQLDSRFCRTLLYFLLVLQCRDLLLNIGQELVPLGVVEV